MLEMIGVGKRVLELGCSNGYMSRLLKQRNCQVTGVDVDPLAAAEARAFCEEVIVADLDARPLVDLLPGTPFDVAIFGDVLEHLRDPWRILDEARAFLGPGLRGSFDTQHRTRCGATRLLQGSFDYQPQGLLDSTHLRFFTLRSVREFACEAATASRRFAGPKPTFRVNGSLAGGRPKRLRRRASRTDPHRSRARHDAICDQSRSTQRRRKNLGDGLASLRTRTRIAWNERQGRAVQSELDAIRSRNFGAAA